MHRLWEGPHQRTTQEYQNRALINKSLQDVFEAGKYYYSILHGKIEAQRDYGQHFQIWGV